MKQEKDKYSKEASVKLKQIVKIIFLMISFRIVMDSHMWVILCLLGFIVMYVLPVYLFKSSNQMRGRDRLNHMISKLQDFSQTVSKHCAVNDCEEQPNSKPKEHLIDEHVLDAQIHHDSDIAHHIDTQSSPSHEAEWFDEDGFHTIWKNNAN